MISIPTPVLKIGQKVAAWGIKNGPRLMSIGGGVMAVGGAVMACKATLRVDEVLAQHNEDMAKIDVAIELQNEAIMSGREVSDFYSQKDIKRDKFAIYTRTALSLAKLYAPAVAVGFAGVGLMQGAFGIMDKRHSTAVAALTSLDHAFAEYRSRVEEQMDAVALDELKGPQLTQSDKLLEIKNDDGEVVQSYDTVVLDPEAKQDPFFFIFDEKNPNWYGNNGYLLNERFLTATLDSYNYMLSAHAKDHIWVNDILRAWGMEETDLGHFHGYNANNGDVIEYELVPYLYYFDEDDDKQFPMLVPTTMENLRELELSDIHQGYCIGIRLKSSSDGYDDVVDPRMIYNEVYGS